MSFQLRREEVLDGAQLSAMLAENPGKAAQAILIAAKQGIAETEALQKGMETKAVEFVKKGAEIYSRV